MPEQDRNEYYRQWREKNRDKTRAASQRHRDKHTEEERERCRAKAVVYRSTHKGRADRLISGAKRRATAIGVPFDLDLDWLIKRLVAGVCEVTGVPFVIKPGRHIHAPSLDRKDPKLGYTKDNVRVTLWCFNAAKGTGTDQDVLIMAQALVLKNAN
jgi:hypothetical protein